jgi:hypothetical protein
MLQAKNDIVDTMPIMPVVDTSQIPMGVEGAVVIAHIAPIGNVDAMAMVIDVDGVGPIEVEAYDTNGDSVIDVIATDLDGDGVLDIAEIDTDFDGVGDEVVSLSDFGDAVIDSSEA